jgi:hypothetical protein
VRRPWTLSWGRAVTCRSVRRGLRGTSRAVRAAPDFTDRSRGARTASVEHRGPREVAEVRREQRFEQLQRHGRALTVEDARATLEAAGWFTGKEVRL